MTTDLHGGAPYRIVLAPGARRALTTTLPAPAACAAWKFINGPLARKPPGELVLHYEPPSRAYGVRVVGSTGSFDRIDDSEGQVVVLDIDHRRDAYKT